MDETLDSLTTVPSFLRGGNYLPRVTRSSGKVLEEALAPSTLFDQAVKLKGCVFEASYLAHDPRIRRRLREGSIPFLCEPQTLRFTGDSFADTDALVALPYAPEGLIGIGNIGEVGEEAFAREVLEFQQEKECAAFVSPGWPLRDRDPKIWLEANRRIWEASCEANGKGEIEARPMLAQVAPGRRVTESPDRLIDLLMDLPFDGVYVQPLRLNPVKDSVEKLVHHVRMLEAFEEAGLRVVASRVGAFGQVLAGLGVSAFDSGLGIAEASDLASLNRQRSEKERDKKGPKGSRRVYLSQLRTTMSSKQAELILRHPTLAGRFSCGLGCCRFQRLDELSDRARTHFLWTRADEAAAVSGRETRTARLDFVHEELRSARDTGRLVRRTLMANLRELPSFDHTDRWIRVLAREAEARAAA